MPSPAQYAAASAAAYKLITEAEERLPFFVKKAIAGHEAEILAFCKELGKVTLDAAEATKGG
jgi:hypothetical protein